MAEIEFIWTRHAREALSERKLQAHWVYRTILSPERQEPDPIDATLTRLFRSLPERGGRILRVVVCFESDERCRVITVFLDRDA